MFAAIEVASSNSSADALLKLANAWALLQPDEPEEEVPSDAIHATSGTFLAFGQGADYDFEERSRVIGFTPLT